MFAPANVSLGANGVARSTLTVSTTSSTPIGATSLKVTAVNGKLSASVTAGLTVNYPLSGSLSLTVSPADVTVSAGQSAVYTAQLRRINLTGPVRFAVASPLPAAATVSFTPNPTTGNVTSMQLTTGAATPAGTYHLALLASGTDARGSTQFAYAAVTLTITRAQKPFGISGNLTGALAPGRTLALNLTLSNPNNKPLNITNLTVTLVTVTRTPAAVSGNLTCTLSDYRITPYTGPYPLSLPAGTTGTLSSLAIPATAWPQVSMLNTTTNQDGCKGAVLSLAYSGSGTGN